MQRSGTSRFAAVGLAATLAVPAATMTAVATPVPVAALADSPTFVVTSTDDLPDHVEDGTCVSTNGQCTLRAAVAESRRSTGIPTIVVPAGTFLLDGGSGDDAGDLDLTRPMRLVGAGRPPGTRATTIDARQSDRVVEVASPGVTIQGIVVTGGAARNGAGAYVRPGAVLDLRDSTILANSASDQGGGIDNAGTLTVTRSAFLQNRATKKGGGLHNAGTVTVTNTTVHGNSSSAGGGIVSSGNASLDFVTVTANSSTNRLGGGVQNAGGVTSISASIVAANASNSGDAKDCSGSPYLLGVNLIGNVQGCNPTGTPPLVGDAGLGVVGDRGGATPAQPLLAGSPAIDAATSCTVAEDQRGVPRPQAAACDLGAFEVDPFGIEIDLTTDVPTIGAGAAVIPNGHLLDAVAAPPGPEASPLRSVPLRSILVESVGFASIPLRSIDAAASPLRSVPLRSIPLRSIFAAFAPLRSIPLRSIPLRSILLSEVTVDHEGGWEDLLADTALRDVPLQALTLADVAALDGQGDIDALTLDDVDLTSTRIGSLSLVSILLGSTPLRSIVLADGGEMCDLLGDACTAEWFTSETTVMTAELAGAPLRSVPLRSILLADLDLEDAPLRSIPLRSIVLQDLAPGSVGTIVSCDTEAFDCDAPGATVGAAFDAGALRGTMADLLLAIAGEESLAWQDIDLTGGGLGAVAEPAEPGLTYTADVRLGGGLIADIALNITIPDGFVAVPGSVEVDGVPVADPSFADQTLDIDLEDVRPGDHAITFRAKAGVVLGEHSASASATANATGEDPVNATDTVSTVVVGEAFEGETPAQDHRPLVPGALHLAHVSAPGDVDLYEFTVSPAEAARGATISILLANLAADFDLALYGPPSVALRGAPVEQRDMLPDHLVDLQPADDNLTAEPTADVPRSLPFASEAVIHRIAARREHAPESIEALGLRAGTYWIQVSGANGASSDQPYVLRTRRSPGIDRGACAAPALAGTPTTRTSTLPTDLDTLFLVNSRRFVAAYGAAGEDGLDDVEAFARSRNGFVGGVLYVDEVAAVQEAYDAWEANRCRPDAANDVVRAIGGAIDEAAVTYPSLANIVIVGDDVQIPMARVQDNTVIANERTFADEFASNNQLVGALGAGYVLTDDALATSASIEVNDHEVFVPTLGIGRLVETPAEIRAVLASYTAAGGRLDPGTALVAGYDFLADGANAVADELGVPAGSPDRLIDETWTREGLTAGLGATRRGVASLNAHFDHHRLLPAAGNTAQDESDLFEATDVAALADRLGGAVLFSMGCHSGLNVSDLIIGGPRDWAQTFAGIGAHWVGNTGFGYGDTETISLSEELMATFAARLMDGESVGAALAAAKRRYLALRPLVSSYDEKVVQESVLYGLPMLRLGDAAPTSSLRTLASAALETPPPPTLEPLAGLPADTASFTFTVGAEDTPSGPDVLTPRTTPEGSYYHVDGQTLTQSRRPIEPLSSQNVTRPGERARGYLITQLQSLDIVDFDPLFFSPTIDLGAHEPRAVAADATFPSTLAALTATTGPDGREDRLVVTPGQYRRTGEAGTGTQRLFTRVGGVVYYADDEPTAPAIGIRRSTATFETDRVRFDVGLDHPAARVYVLYKLLGTTSVTPWQGLDLVQTPGGTDWAGQGPAAGNVEYIVQAVDASGRVVKADRKGDNFGSVDGTVGELEMVPTPAPNAEGWNATPVTVTIEGPPGTNVGTILTSVDGGDYAAYAGPLVLSADGAHSIYAISSEGYSASRIIYLDSVQPTVTAALDPPGSVAPAWNRAAVSLSASASDGGGSGIGSFTFTLDGAAPQPVTGSIAISGDGEHTAVISASDRAGNVRSTTFVVRVDGTSPTLTCPQGDGAWHASNVSVTCTAVDPAPGSGLVPSSLVLATTVATGAANANASAGQATACDSAGNCTSATSTGHMVDLANPTANITTPTAGTTYTAGSTVTVSFACSDQGSGVASCAGRVGTTPVAPGDPLPTASGGSGTLTVTATDNVGRVTTTSTTYSVFAYSICPTYDETQPNNIGSTIPVKLQLCDAAGRNLSSSAIEVRAVTINGTTLPPPNWVGNTNFGQTFRFGQKSYIYNLDTGKLALLGAGTHTMELAINGVSLSTYRVRFTLR